MGRIMGRQPYRDALAALCLLCAAAGLVLWPQEAIAAARDGLRLCGNVIIPSLFPFFVLSSLVVELGMSRYLGRLLEPVMVPLFKVNGTCATALALGFVGGYPVGARTAIALYQNGQCSRTEAERLLAFCNNSGPAFILGVVGTGVFGSGALGLMLYLAHMTASLLVGVLFRFYKAGETPRRARAGRAQFQTASFPAAFTRAVTEGLQSTLNICAFILFFTVVIRLLALSGFVSAFGGVLSSLPPPFTMSQEWAERLLTGLIEMSSGVASLTQGALSGRLSMAAFMLGWAGLSVHCQVLAFLGDSGLSLRTYVAGKLLHGILSAALMGVAVRLFAWEVSVPAYLADQTQAIAQLEFQRALTLSATAVWGTWLAFLGLAVWMVKKSSRKSMRSLV